MSEADIEKNISNLKKYINEDDTYRSYKEKTETYFSDFDLFCIKHCKDIENILAEQEKNKVRIKELEEANVELASKLAETEVNYENLKEIESDHQNQIGKLEVELSKAEKVIENFTTQCKQWRAFCRRIRKDEKHNVDEFNQGREFSYIQFLNLIDGVENWEYEGKHFEIVEEECNKFFESKVGGKDE